MLKKGGGKKVVIFKWTFWSLAILFYTYEFLLRVFPSVMISGLMGAFHTDVGTIGVISALYFYIYAPMQIPVGVLVDRFGSQKLLAGALSLCVFSTFLFGIAQSLFFLGLSRILIGLGSSFAFVCLMYVTSHWFPRKRLGLLIGISNILAMVGAIAGEGPISLVEELVGWRYTVIILSVIGFALTISVFLLLLNQPVKIEIKKTKAKSIRESIHNFLTISRQKKSWMNALCALFLYLPTSGFAALWGVPFLQKVHGMDRSMAGFATSMIFVGWIVGGPLLGYYSDKIKKRRPFLLLFSLLGGIVFFPVILFPLSGTLIYLLLFAVGICSSSQLLNYAYAIDQHSQQMTGAVIAFTNFLTMLGGAVFQTLIGVFLDLFPQSTPITLRYTFTMSIFPAAFFLSFIFALFIREKHPGRRKA
ncbi:MAG: putative sulfoacetate transporter SauU [Chlamydiae bacterium]|nr:putative sulfoacetate transporter SauU [Chlamydiota bacterium]